MGRFKLKIGTFRQGVHPPEYKELTEATALKIMPEPQKVILPMVQHIGAPCQPLVKVGDLVQAGQKIADSEKFVSAPVHASISGRVTAVMPLPHPAGIEAMAVVIEKGTARRDGPEQGEKERVTQQDSASNEEKAQNKDNNKNVSREKDIRSNVVSLMQFRGLNLEAADKQKIRSAVHQAGIVGLGGAAFPTHVKLSPPETKPIDTVILNGCECEPYLTADHRIMLEYADDCILGLKVIMKAVGARKGYIGIEMNKPNAIGLMQEKIYSGNNNNDISVVGLKVKYPQGAEKMLIKALLGREVPSGGLPMDVGAVVDNVGTSVAIARAITTGEPLTKRVVTVTGSGVNQPANLLVTLGTTFEELIEFCGGIKETAVRVIMGGPMMGLSQFTLQVPVVKATSGIVVMTEDKAWTTREMEMPCIRCARCVDHCSVRLLPAELARLVKKEKWDRLSEYNIKDCIECGCCAYICPSKIPLVHLIRLGKLKVK